MSVVQVPCLEGSHLVCSSYLSSYYIFFPELRQVCLGGQSWFSCKNSKVMGNSLSWFTA